VPCGLIIDELVPNRLKHAFPHGAEGTIHIQLGQAPDGSRTLIVADNGVGLPEGFSSSACPRRAQNDMSGCRLLWRDPNLFVAVGAGGCRLVQSPSLCYNLGR
jgi:hypothetical protein